jgi:hypothetical protein
MQVFVQTIRYFYPLGNWRNIDKSYKTPPGTRFHENLFSRFRIVLWEQVDTGMDG